MTVSQIEKARTSRLSHKRDDDDLTEHDCYSHEKSRLTSSKSTWNHQLKFPGFYSIWPYVFYSCCHISLTLSRYGKLSPRRVGSQRRHTTFLLLPPACISLWTSCSKIVNTSLKSKRTSRKHANPPSSQEFSTVHLASRNKHTCLLQPSDISDYPPRVTLSIKWSFLINILI